MGFKIYTEVRSTIFPIFMIRRTTGFGANDGIEFVTRTADVITPVPLCRKWEYFQGGCPSDVLVLTMVTIVSHLYKYKKM